jgi:hypothetical protein
MARIGMIEIHETVGIKSINSKTDRVSIQMFHDPLTTTIKKSPLEIVQIGTTTN